MFKGILNGVRVLDFTWMLAGPYATRILADFGAEVIKIQSKKVAQGTESNLKGYFNTWNRNKRSITLDMIHPEAQALFLKLTTISDVVVDNFSPRVMSNWGLSYEKLREARDDLIVLRMSAMGDTGPWQNCVAYGPTIQALSGLTYLTSFSEDLALGLGFSYADVVAGLYAALTILAALEQRKHSGQGQYIDLSEYEALCSVLGPALLDTFVNDKKVLPQGHRAEYTPAAPYGCYRCSGEYRWCVIAIFNEEEWQAFSHVLGNPAWMGEERFSTLTRRLAHLEELNSLISHWMATKNPETVVSLLQEAGVAAGVVQNAADLAKDPQLLARGFFIPIEHPVLGTTMADASPIKFQDNTQGPWKSSPLLGEDNRYVYMELLGLSQEDFTSYIDRGIIS